ncbi:MAG: DUF192 domain-containing protein [Deltaproteobacteria bacterium]|nr:DUF192 domain-containing protein [Deltaproteobacteria bacterium]
MIALCSSLFFINCSTSRGESESQQGQARNEPRGKQGVLPALLMDDKPQPEGASSKRMPQVVLLPEGREPVRVDVEIARTAEQRRRGLMYRKSLARNRGMLFIFEKPGQLSFWMRNTHIPLDMIFIESGMRILGIVEDTTPLSDESCSVSGESQYVLEVNAGFAKAHGLCRGVKVEFVGFFL